MKFKQLNGDQCTHREFRDSSIQVRFWSVMNVNKVAYAVHSSTLLSLVLYNRSTGQMTWHILSASTTDGFQFSQR